MPNTISKQQQHLHVSMFQKLGRYLESFLTQSLLELPNQLTPQAIIVGSFPVPITHRNWLDSSRLNDMSIFIEQTGQELTVVCLD